MTRPFTGWHMTTILAAFFGVVIGVNMVMARYAIGTFGGTVVDNSYVASQNYNHWLEQADNQAKLGWTPRLSLDPARHIALSVSKAGAPVPGVTATGIALHPLGRAPSIPLTFVATTDGGLLSGQILPAGRWRVQMAISKGVDTVQVNEPVQ